MALQKGVTIFNGSDLNVFATVQGDRLISVQSKCGGGGKFGPIGADFAMDSNQSFDTTPKEGYTLVERCSSVSFYPEEQKQIAYVSIKCAEVDESEYNHLCKNHPVAPTKSGVIITKDFYFKDARKEWEDSDKVSHKPKKTKQKTTRQLHSGLNHLKKKKE